MDIYAISSEEYQPGDIIIPSPAGSSKLFLLENSILMFNSAPSHKGMVPFCPREGIIDISHHRMHRSGNKSYIHPPPASSVRLLYHPIRVWFTAVSQHA